MKILYELHIDCGINRFRRFILQTVVVLLLLWKSNQPELATKSSP